MPIFRLSDDLAFPNVQLTDESGIIAVGGDLSPDRILLAYSQGIFPWPHEGYPLLWFCPPERFVLDPKKIHLSRTLKKTMRRNTYQIKFDTCFIDVMKACQSNQRPGQDRTWITDEMIDGYTALHEQGFAHSIEAFDCGELVGGLYGLSLGGIFFGESMFTRKSEASKTAFATLTAHLIDWDFDLVDCQTQTDYLASFAASSIPRNTFLKTLRSTKRKPTRRGIWSCKFTSQQAVAKITDLAHTQKSR